MAKVAVVHPTTILLTMNPVITVTTMIMIMSMIMKEMDVVSAEQVGATIVTIPTIVDVVVAAVVGVDVDHGPVQNQFRVLRATCKSFAARLTMRLRF